MKSFKQYVLEEEILLAESRIDFLKNQYEQKGISTAHDDYAQHKDTASIIDHLSTHADPTKNKAHSGWLVDKYNKGQFRQEDHARIKDTLSDFEKYKPKLANKDLNSYKTVEDVHNAVAPHIGTAVTNKEKAEEVKNTGIEKIHDDGHNQVYHLKTQEASQQVYGGGAKRGGTGTDWCTAARSKDCMFNNYAKDNGNLYTMHVHNDPKSPYQLHMKKTDNTHEPGQFMDRHDHSANLGEVVNKIPSLKGHPSFSGTHPVFDKSEKVHQELHDYKNLSYVNKAIQSADSSTPAHLYQHVAEKALQHPAGEHKDKDHEILRSLVNNDHTPEHTVDHLVNNYVNGGDATWGKSLATSIRKNPNLSLESSHKLSDHSNTLGNAAYSTPSTLARYNKHPEIISKSIDNNKEHVSTVEAAAENPHSDRSIHEKIMNTPNHHAHSMVLTNPHTHPELLATHSSNPHYHAALSNNPSTPSDSLRHIYNNSEDKPWIHGNLASNKNTPHDILKKLSTHADKDISKSATKTLKTLKVK